MKGLIAGRTADARDITREREKSHDVATAPAADLRLTAPMAMLPIIFNTISIRENENLVMLALPQEEDRVDRWEYCTIRETPSRDERPTLSLIYFNTRGENDFVFQPYKLTHENSDDFQLKQTVIRLLEWLGNQGWEAFQASESGHIWYLKRLKDDARPPDDPSTMSLNLEE